MYFILCCWFDVNGNAVVEVAWTLWLYEGGKESALVSKEKARVVPFSRRVRPVHDVSITDVPFSRSPDGGVFFVRPTVDRCE
jgi:hypothetical protein